MKGGIQMSLNERKKKILKAVIDDYINYAEPIGSRHIAKNHDISLSSATIRIFSLAILIPPLEFIGFCWF